MDYNGDGRDSKSGKVLASTDDRLDSGLDSLKEDEYAYVECAFDRLKVDEKHEDDACEPWKKYRTEDGDTYVFF